MYSYKFEQCVHFVIDREGREYEHDPSDPGGETKFGISKRSYPNEDIFNLTEDRAKMLYFRDYWSPLNCETYEPKMALAVLDTGVNQGVSVPPLLLSMAGAGCTVEQFLFKRLRRYENLVQKDPSRLKYLNDWLLRVIKVSEFQA